MALYCLNFERACNRVKKTK